MVTNYSGGGIGTLSTLSTTFVTTTIHGNISLNTSTTDVPGEDSPSEDNIANKVLLGSILVLIIFLAVSGNILVCIAVFTDRRLKRLNNYFLVSLAIADLLVSSVVMTFAVVNDIVGRWMFGPVFCNIWISADIMCSTASILNLCVISLDRYIHIRDPLKYARWMNWKKVALAILGVWLISVILSFIPINLDWHKTAADLDKVLPPDVCILELSGTYALVSSTISFYIPCIVMLALYCKLYMYARQQVKSIKSTFVHDHLSEARGSGRGSSSKVSDHKAAVTLGVIMGTFLFCWLPFFILNLIEAYCKCAPIILFQILTWLGYFNSCLNPIIYSIFNTEFRDAFKRILFPKSCRCIENRNGVYNSRIHKKQRNGTSTTASDYLVSKVENGSKVAKDSKSPLVEEKITAL